MSVESIVSSLNKKGMQFLCQDNYLECFRALKKAENIVSSGKYQVDFRTKAVTWNNLGVYYKRICENDLALEYFRKSLSVDNSENDVLAETHLNILAVLIRQKKFKLAISHGIQSINLAKSCENYFILATALKNTAEVYQISGKLERSFKMFQVALDLAEKNTPEEINLITEVQEKISELKKTEKKFLFEKYEIKEPKRFLSNSRIKVPGKSSPIKISKSLEKPVKDRIEVNKGVNMTKITPLRKRFFEARPRDPQFRVLEDKIKNIQTQLNDFEVRYQKLEKLTSFRFQFKNENEEQEVKIRNTMKIELGKLPKDSKINARDTLIEFEDLRKQAEIEDLFGYETRSKISSTEPVYPSSISPASLHLKPC